MNSAAILVLSFVGFASCVHATAPQTYDGKWWATIPKDQRIGFLSGYADCAIYDLRKPGLSHFSAINEEPIISQYYSNHLDEQTSEFESIFWKLVTGAKPIEHPPKGETYRDKHGFFDGEYWRQATPSHRLGFVQGYLYCQRGNFKHVGTFSSSPEWYVSQISKWYGLKSPDSDEIDESKMDKKIANVLLTLKDKAKPSVPPKK